MDQCYRFVTFEKMGGKQKIFEKFFYGTPVIQNSAGKNAQIFFSAKRKNVDHRGLRDSSFVSQGKEPCSSFKFYIFG